MKLAVIGSRDFENYKLVKETLDRYEDIECIVSGGATGADTLAENYARAKKIQKHIFLPDYRKHGKKAPFMRNYQIIDEADEVVAFWDGKSKGTKHSIDYAKKQGKPVHIISTEIYEFNLKAYEATGVINTTWHPVCPSCKEICSPVEGEDYHICVKCNISPDYKED